WDKVLETAKNFILGVIFIYIGEAMYFLVSKDHTPTPASQDQIMRARIYFMTKNPVPQGPSEFDEFMRGNTFFHIFYLVSAFWLAILILINFLRLKRHGEVIANESKEKFRN
ncbi:MAG TPA: hypothetical protein VIJ93_08325, partial [bacterium]